MIVSIRFADTGRLTPNRFFEVGFSMIMARPVVASLSRRNPQGG